MTERVSAEQARYQVRFDWGYEGAAAIAADADVIAWVDAIRPDGTGPDAARLPSSAAVLDVTMPSARAAAQWIVDLQHRLGTRIVIAVVAAGATRADGGERTAVEDLLAAGAVIDELARLGLDATSPEAAAAEAAYRGLGNAVAHLLTASVSAADVVPTRESLRPDPALGVDDVRVVTGSA